MGLENLDNALQVLLLARLELVAAGADGPGSRGGAQQADLFRLLRREIQQFLAEHALDAVIARVDCVKVIRQCPAGFDDAAQRVVDHR